MTPSMISACEAHMINTFSAAYPDIPVFMEGQARDPNARLYALFWVIPSEDNFKMGIEDGGKSRNVGIIQADVYGPKDFGAGPTHNVAMFIAKQFHRRPIEVAQDQGWVVFRDASVTSKGIEGEQIRQMVRVPYRYDFMFPV